MNSQPLNDDTLYEQYKAECGGFCEIGFYLGAKASPGKISWGWNGLVMQQGLVRHHLWSLGRRPDLWSNLIVVTEEMHRWFHDHPQEARVLCVVAKLRKATMRGKPEEFTLAEINQAAGKNVLGVIESYTFDSPRFVNMREEAILRLRAMQEVVA